MALEVTPELLRAAEEYVKQELSQHDASHDFWHIQRVRANAKRLATEEGLQGATVQLLELCALLHDVQDWKYSGSEKANASAVADFLKQQGASEALVARVAHIISCVGFKDELGAAGKGTQQLDIEAAVLQDADRLDAIGAIGIARCLTFGGRFNRVLYDPAVPPRENLTKEEYMRGADKATTINHFAEKLNKLKDMMKTKSGKATAEQRHEFMQQYLQQFFAEWDGKA